MERMTLISSRPTDKMLVPATDKMFVPALTREETIVVVSMISVNESVKSQKTIQQFLTLICSSLILLILFIYIHIYYIDRLLILYYCHRYVIILMNSTQG